MLFKVGDPVWGRIVTVRDCLTTGLPFGEHAAVITGSEFIVGRIAYSVDILPDGMLFWEKALRPRRDDYQQHEPRVRREDLPWNTPQKKPADALV